jgi:hypothetical protein
LHPPLESGFGEKGGYVSSDSAKKRAGIGLQCLPTAPKLLIDTAAISVHRRFRAASSHANLSMLHHFGSNAKSPELSHSRHFRDAGDGNFKNRAKAWPLLLNYGSVECPP